MMAGAVFKCMQLMKFRIGGCSTHSEARFEAYSSQVAAWKWSFQWISRTPMLGYESVYFTNADSLGVSMNKSFLNAMLCVACFSVATIAMASESVEEVTSNPSNAPMAEDSGTGITAKMEKFLREDADGNYRGWQLGLHENNPSGGYIGEGEALIQTDPSDPRYGRARTAAFSIAYTNAMADFARTMAVSIAVETINREFRDEAGASRLEAESTDSLMKALADRVSTMSVAALDRGLERLGADPESLPRYSREEKHVLAESLLARNTVTEAAARIRGVRTLATFEDEDNMGVLIIHHPRLERLADRVMTGAASTPKSGDISKVRQAIADLSAEDLIFQHHIRVLPDSEGIPAIISFGQSSPAVTNDDSERRIRMAISNSRRVAETQADGAIAEFLNSTVFAASEVNQNAREYQTVEQTGRSLVRSGGAEFFEDLNNMIRQTARAEVTGITTIRRWQANHPDTGHLYTGVVRMWTPSQNFEYGATLRDGALQPGEGEEEGEQEDGKKKSKVRQSKELMDGDW